jgi:hypothetical protein
MAKMTRSELRSLVRETLSEKRDPGLASPGVSDAWKTEVGAADKRAAKRAFNQLKRLHHLFSLSGLPVWGGYVQALKALNRFQGRNEEHSIESRSKDEDDSKK